jgi:predicted nuclease of predicted toxin-antitoxin system
LKLLLDEMYPPALARALHASGIDAITIIELGMAGTPDSGVFSYAVAQNRSVLTENVADFVIIAAQHSTTGARHPGLLIALSNRFSRRASGRAAIVKAIQTHRTEELTDRIIYLEAPPR